MRRGRGRGYGGDWYEPDGRAVSGQLEEDLANLEGSMRPYSIEIPGDARDRIMMFSHELLDWNDRLNLLSRADAPNVIRKHVAASLGVLLAVHPSPADHWVDVGTGAGFPGLVLKIVRPELHIDLLDSARKRCLFLENTLRLMGIRDVKVMPKRVETMIAHSEGVGHYSVMTVRAVTSLPETLIGFGALVADGGRIITFKGPTWRDEVDVAKTDGSMTRSGFELESVTRIPWTAGHLLTLRKQN